MKQYGRQPEDLNNTCALNEEAEGGVPYCLACPLTCSIMSDPVIDHEGNSYEREAITKWLKKREESPITRSPLYMHNLITNRSLQNTIKYYQQNILGTV